MFHFWVELVHLVEAIFGSQDTLRQLIESVGYKAAPLLDASNKQMVDAAGNALFAAPKLNETVIMLVVLALIDVVMISNL